MTSATHLTVRLVRFAGGHEPVDASAVTIGNPLWSQIGRDERGADHPSNTTGTTSFLALALHADVDSARSSFDAGASAVPWAAQATEVWTGLLAPFSHRGALNWLTPDHPGGVYECSDAPSHDEPFAVVTTVGYDVVPDFDWSRAIDFGTGVDLVRDSMTDVDGLQSQQVFNVPDQPDIDPLTFTIWRDDAAMRAFAYRPGVHKEQMDRYRELGTADRTSFTRLRVLASDGTWCGTDPLAW